VQNKMPVLEGPLIGILKTLLLQKHQQPWKNLARVQDKKYNWHLKL